MAAYCEDSLPEDLQDINFDDLIDVKAPDVNDAVSRKKNKMKVEKYKSQVRMLKDVFLKCFMTLAVA